MNLTKYQELTGIVVSEADENLVNAQIRRTRGILESMLGFTLDPNKTNTNIYNEVGKVQNEYSCPNVDISELLPADDVINAYRLYNYNEFDKYFFIDPFLAVHKVKLAYIKPGYPDESSITIKTFDNDEVRIQYGRDSVGKFIEKIKKFYFNWLSCNCSSMHVQLAVDADWMFQDCLPEDLLYIWADMITYEVDCKKDIRSESIEGHSYTKFDRVSPVTESQNLAIIKKYAGPYGSVVVMPV